MPHELIAEGPRLRMGSLRVCPRSRREISHLPVRAVDESASGEQSGRHTLVTMRPRVSGSLREYGGRSAVGRKRGRRSRERRRPLLHSVVSALHAATALAPFAPWRPVAPPVREQLPYLLRAETFELLGSRNRLHPMMAVGRMELCCRCREVRISEITDCDCQNGTTRKRPKHCGSACWTKVVADLVTARRANALTLKTVVDLRVACDRDALGIGKNSADLERTPCPLLTEIAVAGHDGDRFVLNCELYLSTRAFGRSRHS